MKKTGNLLPVFAKGLLVSVILMPGGNVTLARDLAEHAAVATFDSQNAALKKNTEGKGFGPQSPHEAPKTTPRPPKTTQGAPRGLVDVPVMPQRRSQEDP